MFSTYHQDCWTVYLSFIVNHHKTICLITDVLSVSGKLGDPRARTLLSCVGMLLLGTVGPEYLYSWTELVEDS